jgi:ATP diphosphatase
MVVMECALMPKRVDIADALGYSRLIQAAASSEGFDWPDVSGVLDKVEEEIGEIRDALAAGDEAHARKELGDLLLIAVNLARFLGADPREELIGATDRFENRFRQLKFFLQSEGKSIRDCAPEALEATWQRIKPEADKLLSEGLDMGRVLGANSVPDFYQKP